MNQPGIKKLEKWSEGKPRFLVLLAMNVLPQAGILSSFLRTLGQRHKLGKLLPPPDPEVWRSYYRDHRIWAKTLCQVGGMEFDDGLDLVDVLDGLRDIARRYRLDPEATKAEMEAAFKSMPMAELEGLWLSSSEFWDEVLLDSYKEAISDELSDEEYESIGQFIRTDAAQFLVRVWLPCWVLHQKQPGEIYASARRGNTDALENLLRIDKTRITDPVIMRHLSDSAYGISAAHYKRLASAVADQSIKIPNSKQLKTRFSALVSQWSTKAGHRISAPEIRELYDIIASIKDGKAIDTDFPGSPEAFSKAISRQPKWPYSVADKN